MKSFEDVAPILIQKLEEKKDKLIQTNIQKYKENNSKRAGAILALIYISQLVAIPNISINNKTYKPTKIEAQKLFLTLITVSYFLN